MMLGALACSIAMVGCAKREVTTPASGNGRVELTAGLSAIAIPSGRATVETGNTFAASIAGWETSESSADYTVAHKWYSTADIKATTDPEVVVLTPEQLYNENTATKTYMKAWYPQGTPAAGGLVTFDADKNSKDGLVDVLFADAIWATAAVVPSAPLAFKHMLSQLRFEIVGDANYDKVDNKVTAILVENVELPTGLNLATNTVTYQAAADQNVPEVDGAGVAIGTTAAAVGSPMMVRPFAGNTFNVDVTTAQATYSDVKVTIATDPTFTAGKSYLIKLRFIGSAISVESTVEEWVEGPLGSGIVK